MSIILFCKLFEVKLTILYCLNCRIMTLSDFTTAELELFLHMLVDETAAGTIKYIGANKAAFEDIGARLQAYTGKTFTADFLEHEYGNLFTRFALWKMALECRRVHWNQIENKLEVKHEDVWKLLAQDPVYAFVPKCFRDSGERYWWELEAIFGKPDPPTPPTIETLEYMSEEDEEVEVIVISSSDEEN
ncbi:hypothetical protein ACJIZ3_021613 [Penstemon smallii]|uniref:Peptidase S59 domain-containing protein n=1 Tax=Penstemon smallii TaxID=265156 RepID=A0ABD3SM10_9LAMI